MCLYCTAFMYNILTRFVTGMKKSYMNGIDPVPQLCGFAWLTIFPYIGYFVSLISMNRLVNITWGFQEVSLVWTPFHKRPSRIHILVCDIKTGHVLKMCISIHCPSTACTYHLYYSFSVEPFYQWQGYILLPLTCSLHILLRTVPVCLKLI